MYDCWSKPNGVFATPYQPSTITTSPSGSREAPTQNSSCWKSRELSFFSGAAPLRPPARGSDVPVPSREPLAGVEVDTVVMSLHLSQVGEAGLEAVGARPRTAEHQGAQPAHVAAGEQGAAEARAEQQPGDREQL